MTTRGLLLRIAVGVTAFWACIAVALLMPGCTSSGGIQNPPPPVEFVTDP